MANQRSIDALWKPEAEEQVEGNLNRTINHSNLLSLSASNRYGVRNRVGMLQSKSNVSGKQGPPSEAAQAALYRGAQSHSQSEIFSPIRSQF